MCQTPKHHITILKKKKVKMLDTIVSGKSMDIYVDEANESGIFQGLLPHKSYTCEETSSICLMPDWYYLKYLKMSPEISISPRAISPSLSVDSGFSEPMEMSFDENEISLEEPIISKLLDSIIKRGLVRENIAQWEEKKKNNKTTKKSDEKSVEKKCGKLVGLISHWEKKGNSQPEALSNKVIEVFTNVSVQKLINEKEAQLDEIELEIQKKEEEIFKKLDDLKKNIEEDQINDNHKNKIPHNHLNNDDIIGIQDRNPMLFTTNYYQLSFL